MSDLAAGLSAIGDQATVTGLIVAHELRNGEVLAGRFRIDELLGIGGMGVVYRARDLSLDIDVAIKLLRPELARRPEAFERFRNELLLARQVSSPHVVRIHDIARDGERWLISMDYIDGESLERRLERHGPLPLDAAIALTRGLLSGLAAAHQCGVVHRDLKPANILFDRNDRPYITDFGVARSLGATGVTQTGLIIGTPEYLSPEQARGEAVDGRSDLYTVGLILYEALSGSLPFAGGTPAETVMRRLVRPPPSLERIRPELPRWLHAFDDRLLRLAPAQRFDSAELALRALEQQRVPRPPLSRRTWLLALLVMVGALGLFELGRRGLPLLRASLPAATASVSRIAVLPLETDAGDAALAALAEAEARNALGVGYERLGQLDAAAEQYTRAADMRASLRDLRGEATSLRNLAVVRAIRGEREAAEASLDRARRSLEALGDRASIADLHNDRGVVAEERGDYRAALAAFREALALRQQLDQPSLLAQSLNNVAFCYFQLGETDNAAVYWQQALASFRQIDDREAALQVTQSMGLLEINRGQYAAAGQRLDASLREAQDLQLPEEIDVAQVYLGELALAEGRSGDALAAATAASAGFQKRIDPRGRVEADLLAARAALFLGNAAGAQAALDAVDADKLGAEQRAQYLLARSRLSLLTAADTATAAGQLADAEKAADEAGNVALRLEARIEHAHRALASAGGAAALIDELVVEATRRGQAPLRLAVIELELRRGLRGNTAAAVARYREAQSLLRQLGRWNGAARVHELGARVLERAGHKAEAEAAASAAARARAQLVEAAPPALREPFAQRLAASAQAGD